MTPMNYKKYREFHHKDLKNFLGHHPEVWNGWKPHSSYQRKKLITELTAAYEDYLSFLVPAGSSHFRDYIQTTGNLKLLPLFDFLISRGIKLIPYMGCRYALYLDDVLPQGTQPYAEQDRNASFANNQQIEVADKWEDLLGKK